MSDLQTLEQAVLVIDDDTPTEVLLELGGKLDFIRQNEKLIRDLWEEKMIQRIRLTPEKSITTGTIRYYEGVDRTTKCRNKALAMDTALALAGGDFERAAEDYLASEPFKQGAMAKALIEQPDKGKWDELFEVKEKPSLEEGKPKKQLMKLDTKFLK